MSNQSLTPPFGPQDVEVLERETPFQGFFRVDTLTLRHKHYNGGWGEPVRRELFVRPPAAAVLPYDPVRGEILLVEQFRVGALEWRDTPWCLELIAGIADKDGESAADLIRREAVEEAGLTLGAMESIAAYTCPARVAPTSACRCLLVMRTWLARGGSSAVRTRAKTFVR